MMELLPQVHHGRLPQAEAKMAEYGGQKLEAAVLPGGVKIAGIAQSELVLGDGASVMSHGNMKPSGYDPYMTRGPRMAPEEMEISQMHTHEDATPLLPPHHGFTGQQVNRSPSSEYLPPMHSGMQGYATNHSVNSHSTLTQQPMYPADPYNRNYAQPPPQGYGRPYPQSREPSSVSTNQYQEQGYRPPPTNSRQARGW